jgi:RimJ/RimL family protein N-acetyltransferase
MTPVELRTPRLLLDQPTERDIAAITEYCQDPLFEHVLTTPWPYQQRHARAYVMEHVQTSWANETEFTWALRTAPGGQLLGVVSNRTAHNEVGFWLGAAHRGNGYMPEAVAAVLDWAFARGAERIRWECVVGNAASAAVARKCGFRFTGEAPGARPGRDGLNQSAWHGELLACDDRAPKLGWPA